MFLIVLTMIATISGQSDPLVKSQAGPPVEKAQVAYALDECESQARDVALQLLRSTTEPAITDVRWSCAVSRISLPL